MKFIKNIYDAAEFYFFTLGVSYILALLLWRNGYFVVFFEQFFTLADTPLVICTVVYFLSGHLLSSHQRKLRKKHSHLSSFEEFITISIVIILLFTYLVTDFLSEPLKSWIYQM